MTSFDELDLLLIHPSNRQNQFARLKPLAALAPPIGLAMLAAYIRHRGHAVGIIDAEADNLSAEEVALKVQEIKPRLVGVSAMTTRWDAALLTIKALADIVPEIPRVFGGSHAAAMPRESLEAAPLDYLICGEGFYPLAQLLDWIKNKSSCKVNGLWIKTGDKIIKGGLADLLENLDELPPPAFDLLPMEKYKCHHWQAWDYDIDGSRYGVLYTSLGCPFSCDYCSVNLVYGTNKPRYRSPERVADDVEDMVVRHNVRHIQIIDDTFTLLPDRVKAICRAIIARGLGSKINCWCFARADKLDPQMLGLMKQAGINWAYIGFESGVDSVLDGVHKGVHSDRYADAIAVLHDNGIHCGGNFLFGLPKDTLSTMQQTLDMACQLNPDYANFFPMMAYPGTKMHDQAKERGYMLPTQSDQYGFYAPNAIPLRNEHVSAEEILLFRDYAFLVYYSRPEYHQLVKERFGANVSEYIQNTVLGKSLHRDWTIRRG